VTNDAKRDDYMNIRSLRLLVIIVTFLVLLEG
jgi:hypothetical protein